jgi:hypothetical protein
MDHNIKKNKNILIIKNQKSIINNQKSKINNQKSIINNQKSIINNQKHQKHQKYIAIKIFLFYL